MPTEKDRSAAETLAQTQKQMWLRVLNVYAEAIIARHIKERLLEWDRTMAIIVMIASVPRLVI